MISKRFNGGGCTGEDDGDLEDLSDFKSDLAGVISGCIGGFIGGIMFFIDNNQTEFGEGSKDSASGSKDDIDFTLLDFLPMEESFFWGQVGMDDSDFFSEVALELSGSLRGEGDFGDEDQGLFFFLDNRLCKVFIDFGFTGSGCPEDQEGGEGGFL